MRNRRPIVILWLLVLGLVVSLWWFWGEEDESEVVVRSQSTVAEPDEHRLQEVEALAEAAGAVPSIDQLNAPGGTIQRDIQILDATFEQWLTNFPAEGNPVGTNAEITAALTGKNHLGLDLIPADHPAINEAGELVDRWGTPFRFHQLSGTVMEIVSAGPDRKFATADDVRND